MDQNYKNHKQMVPGFHYFTGLLVTACLVGGFIFLARRVYYHKFINVGLLIFSMTVVLLMLSWYLRVFALKAQDRAIRAEENLRHFALTGKLLDSRLRMGQIIALRFAGDDEFLALAKKAADEEMKPDDIKKAIQNWRPDYDRA